MSLTGLDLKNIKELFQEILNQTLNLEPNQTFDNKLDEKISHLPTKEEFCVSQDKLSKEIGDARDEKIILSGMKVQVNNHEIRIEKIEKKVGLQVTA